MSGSIKAGLFLAAMCLASSASAQTGPGPGPGPGPGSGNTPGWSLMTPAERTEHHNKMMSFTNYEECIAYLQEHHKLMQERAKAQGTTIPAIPRSNMCERLKHDSGSN